MSNVTVMNFAYDVAVKGFAMTLALMAFFLLAPDLHLLIAVLVLNRSAASRQEAPPFTRPRWNTMVMWGKCAYVAFAVFTIATKTIENAFDLSSTALSGIYEVEQFTRHGSRCRRCSPTPPVGGESRLSGAVRPVCGS